MRERTPASSGGDKANHASGCQAGAPHGELLGSGDGEVPLVRPFVLALACCRRDPTAVHHSSLRVFHPPSWRIWNSRRKAAGK
jgi:hypothetical protein